ncbi:glycosyltransferase family 4 protein [Hungatella hathewayi]|uniref:Glycosyl transferase family 1 domain-containing protein n=1 Tax=Hungatella hathewayi WAL-18680 TaxID=742737 RepID=G5IBG9_9FIRM|nr:glycosyltransferase family 4 protein [Hungatella hathewayi]EHI61132.1 hypothetical protein HMPREF9473_00747 [ [Hungatella hathewayi WAL-18680]
MKKAIIIASTASMILQFNMNNIKILQESGYEVMVACNFTTGNSVDSNTIKDLKKQLKNINVMTVQIPIPRNPLAFRSIILSYKILKQLSEQFYFSIMHCHSPIGAAVARSAFKKSHKTGTKIIYTAHGFHFYKGAPLHNWMLYYPIEYLLSKWTDVIITINTEDYNRARKFGTAIVAYTPGIGIHLTQESTVSSANKRRELGIPENAFLMLSVGELNRNKNHQIIIKAMARINHDSLYYVICGQGGEKSALQQLAQKLGIENRVKLLGFRTDMEEIYPCANVFILPSYREGLSVALMEAMSYGLPCIVSCIRGNIDLIDDNLGGYTVLPNDVNGFVRAIKKTLNNNVQKLGFYNKEKIQCFSIEKVAEYMRKIYLDISLPSNTKKLK